MSRPVTPAQLHLTLSVAPSIDLRFMTEKALNAYRASLYNVNQRGNFLYRSRRNGLTLNITRHA